MTDDRRPPMMGQGHLTSIAGQQAAPIPFGAPTRPRPVSQIDHAAEEAIRLLGIVHASETPPPAPTYRSCVADSINECRYLDVKGIAKEIMGEPAKPIETAADLADRMAEWAAENKTKVTA